MSFSFGQVLPGDLIVSAASTRAGALLCDGSAISRTTYAALFAAISTTYGTGDGSTTFNVPDLRGRAIISSGTGSGLSARALGQSVGEETHLLSTGEMPSHSHGFGGGSFDTVPVTIAANATGNAPFTVAGTSVNAPTSSGAWSDTTATRTAGSGGTHNNMQPSLVVNYFIKT